ncbi:hypothetical protein GCM10017752_09670 [Streptomyces roseoviridis]
MAQAALAPAAGTRALAPAERGRGPSAAPNAMVGVPDGLRTEGYRDTSAAPRPRPRARPAPASRNGRENAVTSSPRPAPLDRCRRLADRADDELPAPSNPPSATGPRAAPPYRPPTRRLRWRDHTADHPEVIIGADTVLPCPHSIPTAPRSSSSI